MQPAFRDLGYREGSFPVTEQFASQLLSLPMYAELAQGGVEYVAESILAFGSQSNVEPLLARGAGR